MLAHYALGNLCGPRGRISEAGKSYEAALRLLEGHPPEMVLDSSDGLTAGRFTEMIQSMLHAEAIP